MSESTHPLLHTIQQRLATATAGEPIESMFQILQENLLPPAIFQQFALDCAKRALAQEEARGNALDPGCSRALEAKQRWLHQEIDDAAMAEVVREARSIAHAAAIQKEGMEAAASVADATGDVEYSLRAAAWALSAAEFGAPPEQAQSARQAEIQWQVERFLTLVRQSLKASA